jgi:hypothetical protein
LPHVGLLKYQQARLPLRNSGSTPACTGKVSIAPASATTEQNPGAPSVPTLMRQFSWS